MFGFLKKKEEEESQTFSDLIRGLQYSVNTAQQALEKHHLYLLSRFTDEDGNIQTKRVTLPNGDVVDIPIMSFMNMGALAIDELELEFDTKVDHAATKEYSSSGYTRSYFDIDVTSSTRNTKGNMHVKIKFKNKDIPESVARLTDELNKFMSPKQITKNIKEE